MTEQATAPPAAPPELDINFVKQFMLQRQGRWFVTYQGLLYLAHQKGLVGIEVNILLFPDDSNGRTCVCRADVRLERDGRVLTFADIGDASPGNVSKLVLPHIMRMASTRAKARALRDAVNIGYVTLEELTEEGETQAPAYAQDSQSGQGSQGSYQNRPRSGASEGRDRPSVTGPPRGAPARPPRTADDPSDEPPPDWAGNSPADGDERVTIERFGANEWRVRYKGAEWVAPEVVTQLKEGTLQAYASWVQQIHSATTIGQLQTLFPKIEPIARKHSDDLGDHVKELFADRKKIIYGKSNGHAPISN